MSVLSRKIDRVMCNILHPPIPPGPNAMYSPSTHNQPPVQRYPNAMYSMHAPMCNQIWNIPPSVPTPSATPSVSSLIPAWDMNQQLKDSFKENVRAALLMYV